MLRSLSITNIAVIANARIEFENGLNILTGETGAGKSIIIDAINLILGNRSSKEMIRTGEEKAKVEALFDIDKATCEKLIVDMGIECEDELLISREINLDGKNVIRINGNLSTATILKNIGTLLINIHGQHDNQDLLNSEKHIHILDSFAKNAPLLEEYKITYKDAYALSKELESMQVDRQEMERKLSILNYEIECIEKAALKEGEYEELLEQRKLISNSQKIIENINEAYGRIYSGTAAESAYELLSFSLKKINEIASFDKNISRIQEKLSQVFFSLEDVSEELRNYISAFDFDASTIDMVEGRLDEINDLRRRYGKDYTEIMEYYNRSVTELNSIKFMDENADKLKEELAKKKSQLKVLGEQLSKQRKEAALQLENSIMQELNDLNMQNTKFKVDIQSEDKFLKDGLDRVEFLIAPNAGIELHKLTKIASGGELSRIMLAINSALLHLDEIPTMIYDEIDAGVSGRAAQKIAEKLYNVSKNRQVLCVTHLAQIAAMADHHYLIEKSVYDNTTKTSVKKLEENERIEELSRILGGVTITKHTLENAKDMIKQSVRFKA